MSARGSVGFRWGTITGPYHANFSQVETQKFDPHWFYCLQWGCNNLFCQECTCFGPNGASSVDYLLTTLEKSKYLASFDILDRDICSDHCPISFSFHANKGTSLRRESNSTHNSYEWDPKYRITTGNGY